MPSSPPLLRRLMVVLVAFLGAGAAAHAAAQEPGVAHITLRDGTELRGQILLNVPGKKLVLEHDGETRVLPAEDIARMAVAAGELVPVAPADAATAPCSARPDDFAELFRQQELARLTATRDRLRAHNRRWLPAAIAVGVGLGMTMLGAILIAQTNQDSHEGRGDMARAGAALTPLGAVLTLVSAPILIVRASRSARLRETEQTMQGLSGPLSLSPVWSRGQLGLIGRLRF